MAFVGEGLELVRDGETGEEGIERAGVAYGDDGIGLSVEDEGGRIG